MDPICAIEIEVAKPHGYRARWGAAFAQAPVAIYGGLTPETIDFARPLVACAEHEALIPVSDLTRRWYFHLQPQAGTALTVGQRDIPLEGSTNLRDLGGYATHDGRRVRWGTLFRSGHLSRLTEQGLGGFGALGVTTICDFRTSEEREGESAMLPNSPRIETLGIAAGINDRFYLQRLFASTDNPQVILYAVHELLRSFVIDYAPRYARMFDVLLGSNNGGILLNCSAGKERTGIGTALLLLALGVPRTTVRYDFMLSAKYYPMENEIERTLRKYSVKQPTRVDAVAMIMPLLETRESYIDRVFAAIDETHGSDAAYLQRASGLNQQQLERLRSRFLV
ncbi:MAG: tyrosine-protein phosphatase [Gammaproteobacteria bacterium]